MKLSKSSNLWVSMKSAEGIRVPDYLGPTGRRIANEDPLYFAMYAARYKFVARMVTGLKHIVEIGAGDGFGANFLSAVASDVVCIDIDQSQTEDCQNRFDSKHNLKFICHDLISGPVGGLRGCFDALAMVDVIEHIYPDEQSSFLENSFALLAQHGFAIIGTPNVEASRFAGERSRRTHVNLHSAGSLRLALSSYFSNVLSFGMNDEVLHTGFHGMSHYLWAIAFGLKERVDRGLTGVALPEDAS